MKLTKYIDYFESPIGLLRICSNENILTECTLVDKHFSEDCSETGGAALSAKIQLQEYFLRKRKPFDVEIDFSSGTDFQKKIWPAPNRAGCARCPASFAAPAHTVAEKRQPASCASAICAVQ